jgi:hypothetical protein
MLMRRCCIAAADMEIDAGALSGGGGGGSANVNGLYPTGNAGGSGIVIVRYPV